MPMKTGLLINRRNRRGRCDRRVRSPLPRAQRKARQGEDPPNECGYF